MRNPALRPSCWPLVLLALGCQPMGGTVAVPVALTTPAIAGTPAAGTPAAGTPAVGTPAPAAAACGLDRAGCMASGAPVMPVATPGVPAGATLAFRPDQAPPAEVTAMALAARWRLGEGPEPLPGTLTRIACPKAPDASQADGNTFALTRAGDDLTFTAVGADGAPLIGCGAATLAGPFSGGRATVTGDRVPCGAAAPGGTAALGAVAVVERRGYDLVFSERSQHFTGKDADGKAVWLVPIFAPTGLDGCDPQDPPPPCGPDVAGAGTCRPAPLPPFEKAFKGWELYSVEQDGHWRYVLLPGTNREKTAAEIANPTAEAAGPTIYWVRDWIARMPAGEEVFWRGPYPPKAAIDQIKAWAKDRGVTVNTTP